MLFNSLDFLIFFPLVTIIYYLLPFHGRVLWLLAASAYFYMAFIPAYILILAVTIVIDYFAAFLIQNSRSSYQKKLFLFLSLATTLAFLAFFKYAGFLTQNIDALARFFHWNYSIKALEIILPIGLSFHTFQGMAYVIEVYKGRQAPEKNFFVYSLYVLFYPQLVAGPIERPQNLLPQFHVKHDPDYARIQRGLAKMLWGFFKKLVIADRLAVITNHVFNQPGDFQGFAVWIAMYAFAFQIYCDFSGYSDIALGAAEVMGIRLTKNFNKPYLSASIQEFWKRWHISLSTWFRDYVYIPLGGSRVSPLRQTWNILTVFTLSGLWHGANWTFVAWGALHGAFLILFHVLKQPVDKLWVAFRLDRFSTLKRILGILLTFHLVCLAWILFRAASISDAATLYHNLFRNWDAPLSLNLGLNAYELSVGLAAVGILLASYRLDNPFTRPIWMRWTAYYFLMASILFFGYDKTNQFIYFQF